MFFSHCPLHCVYCQNADLAAGKAGRVIEVGRLADICLELQDQGALNINFVTPTHYSIDIAEAVKVSREQGLTVPVVWNTSGYERADVVRELVDIVDVWLVDFKYADSSLAQRYSQAPDYPAVALKAIGAMVEVAGKPTFDEVDGLPRMTRGVIVRHLALPDSLTQSKQALALLWERFGASVKYSVMNQYTPVMSESTLERFPELASRVTQAEYEELLDYADSLGMEDYFWQESPAALESFIPAWDCSGV